MLTRIQIITEGLSQAGRTDLVSNGRLWLNLFLGKIYRNQDFDWLIKDSGIVSLVEGGAFPTDYRAMKAADLVLNGVVQTAIQTVLADEWSWLKRGSAILTGSPRYCYPDQNLRTFHFWPQGNGTFQWKYYYYHMPTLPDPYSNVGDATTPKWELDDDILIRAIQKKALYYNDDKRYDAEEKALIQEVSDARMNSIDTRAGKTKLRLGKSFRRRF